MKTLRVLFAVCALLSLGVPVFVAEPWVWGAAGNCTYQEPQDILCPNSGGLLLCELCPNINDCGKAGAKDCQVNEEQLTGKYGCKQNTKEQANAFDCIDGDITKAAERAVCISRFACIVKDGKCVKSATSLTPSVQAIKLKVACKE